MAMHDDHPVGAVHLTSINYRKPHTARMTMSRRTLLAGGAGSLVLLATGGVGLVEAKVLPGRARLDAALGWDGGAGVVPATTPGPVESGTFRSTARRTTVGYSILRPPGQTGTLPMAVVLHGKDADHTSAITDLHYDAFLVAAVAGGVPPFALVTVDGGNTVYWHRRADGDDPATMIADELLPIAAQHGLATDRIGLTGWSMGGYGALLIGGQLGPSRVSTVAALSPAIFADFASSSAGSYDSAADFAANDPRRFPARLASTAVRIDCGTDDPFADQAEQMRAALPTPPAGGMSRGAHTGAYMTRLLPAQLDFLGRRLHA